MDDALLDELELKRQLMIKTGIEKGLQSHETLYLSEQVDRLINAIEEERQHLFNINTFYNRNS